MNSKKIFVDVRINYVTRMIAFNEDEVKDVSILVGHSECQYMFKNSVIFIMLSFQFSSALK